MSRHILISNELSPVLGLEGEMAEIGVYQGFTAKFMHNSCPTKIIHLYDTFKGIVKADKSIDVHSDGDFSDTSVEAVKLCMGESPNVKYHVGIFPDTFTEYDSKFCFVYSDTDTYFGTRATLDIFAGRMVIGGKIMFDDYEWRGCPGVKKAIVEFLTLNSTHKTSRSGSQFTIGF